MGLYEQLLKERAEEEGRRGGPLPMMRGLDSKALNRRLESGSENHPPGYTADLSMIYRLLSRGIGNQGEAYRFHNIMKKYPKEYAELRAEAYGQGELLH